MDELADLHLWLPDFRLVFVAANGPPPWACGLCGEPVRGLTRAARGCVHHIDEDRANSRYTNLVAMHRACHAVQHGRPASEELKAKLRAVWSDPAKRAAHAAYVRDVWSDPELRARHSAAINAPEARARAAAKLRIRVDCPHACGYRSTKAWVTRHLQTGCPLA
jgi:hypothetical protein